MTPSPDSSTLPDPPASGPDLAPPRQTRLLAVAWVLLLGTGTAGTAFAPYLLIHAPLVLIALNALNRHVVFVAPVAPLAAVLLIASTRRLLTSLGAFAFGRIYGDRVLGWVEQRGERAGRWMRWATRLFDRAPRLLLLLSPNPLFVMLAAHRGLRLATVVAITALAHVAAVTLVYLVGYRLSAWIGPTTAFIGEYVVELTLVCVVVTVLVQLLRRRSNALPIP